MRIIPLLIMCLALASSLESVGNQQNYPDVIRLGTTAFWGKGTPMEKYGDGTPFMVWQPADFGSQVRMWQIGSGVLVMEHTAGLVRVVKMTYVIRDKNGTIIASLPVKDFNHLTGELTILVPNKASAPDGAPAAEDGQREHRR